MAEQKINVDLNLQKLKLIDPSINPKTTTERLTMTPTAQEGLTVWDSDLNAFFVWDAPTLTWLPQKQKLYLPTPKIYIPTNGFQNQIGGQDPSNVFGNVNPSQANKPIIIKLYYEGNDSVQDWMALPELKYELIRMKNSQKKARNAGGQKKAGGSQYVHPSHKDGGDRAGSSYSGGRHTDVGGNIVAQRDTRWDVNTQSNKGASQSVGNNPYTEIEIDPKLWFYDYNRFGVASYGNEILPLRHIEYIDNNVRVSGYSRANAFSGIQTFKFCFRISCADPTSWNANKNRYDKRMYSDYSKEYEIYPHGGIFEYGGSGQSGDFEKVYYEYRIRPI
jgi:hypothetical protein